MCDNRQVRWSFRLIKLLATFMAAGGPVWAGRLRAAASGRVWRVVGLPAAASAFLAMIPGLGAAGASAPPGRLVTYPAPQGEPASADYTLTVNGQAVFVYTARCYSGWKTWSPDVAPEGVQSFAYFDFEGTARIGVKPARAFGRAVVRPRSSGIVPSVEEKTIAFDMTKPGNLIVEPDGALERPLLLFANPLERDAPRRGARNVLYYGPGVHEVEALRLQDNMTLYIAGGAILRGKFMPGEKPHGRYDGADSYAPLISAHGAKNVTIRGRGIIDSIALPWHAKFTIMVDKCTNVKLEGLIIANSSAWCASAWECTGVSFVKVRAMSPHLNGDGLNMVNSQNVVIQGCFARTNDDQICVKTQRPPPAPEARNILVEDCLIWNERNFGIGVTFENRQVIRDVTFRNCDIVHSSWAAIAIDLWDSATVSDVRFEDIRVEALRGGLLVGFWIGRGKGTDAERGHLRRVALTNLQVVDGSHGNSELNGFDAAHLIEDVTFTDFRVNGTVIEDLAAAKIGANQHTKDIRIVRAPPPPPPAPPAGSGRAGGAAPSPAAKAPAVVFDTAAKPTPEPLKPLLVATVQWLGEQHPADAALVAGANAHRQLDHCVLVLEVGADFAPRPVAFRQAFAARILDQWQAACLKEHRAADADHSVLLFVDAGRTLVGGYRTTAGAKVWLAPPPKP